MRAAGLVLTLCSGCAATTLAPGIVRLAPVEPTKGESYLGVRTGPRIGTAVETQRLQADLGFQEPPELGSAFELQIARPLIGGLSVHLGAQGEVFFGLPAPAFGAMAGLSWFTRAGPLGVAPAFSVRGATDFGLSAVMPPGSMVGADVSVSISLAEGETAQLGLTPFASVQRSFGAIEVSSLLAGALVTARFLAVELQLGLGRVFTGTQAWNVPMLGIRTGGN